MQLKVLVNLKKDYKQIKKHCEKNLGGNTTPHNSGKIIDLQESVR